MADTITKDQLDELSEVQSYDRNEYHKLLKEYAGIDAEPCVAYSYYDDAGNYLGDSCNSDVRDILEAAYIRVV